MRHIILDTETTGLSHSEGHRIIEIGAVEMVNFSLTGERLHLYINPEREIDEGAVAIHGITSEFLTDKPLFQDIAAQFLEFIGDDMLVIHNAPFDVGFLNAELARMAKAALSMDRVVDTLQMARQKFPGAQASLDALCRRFDIDNTHRECTDACAFYGTCSAICHRVRGLWNYRPASCAGTMIRRIV
ncbi:MAG: DNA polymerase III subunit epsilon, partial [Candidatus Puniceispirillaceae bacterium]